MNDRSIVIQLRRKLVHEKTEKLRHVDPYLFNDLQRKLLRFVNDYSTIIISAPTYFPENIRISDRALDNWEPLLAIAKLAGNFWVEKVYHAAMSFSENDKETLPIGTELLKDIEKIFSDKAIIKIHTVDLINYLCEDEESPWSIYNFRGQDKKITPRQLSKLLSPYQISTKNIEIAGVQRKGFDKIQFAETWERYNNKTSSNSLENSVFTVQPSTSMENSTSAVIPHPSTHVSSLPSSILENVSTNTIYSSVRPENISKIAAVDGWTPKMVGL